MEDLPYEKLWNYSHCTIDLQKPECSSVKIMNENFNIFNRLRNESGDHVYKSYANEILRLCRGKNWIEISWTFGKYASKRDKSLSNGNALFVKIFS